MLESISRTELRQTSGTRQGFVTGIIEATTLVNKSIRQSLN